MTAIQPDPALVRMLTSLIDTMRERAGEAAKVREAAYDLWRVGDNEADADRYQFARGESSAFNYAANLVAVCLAAYQGFQEKEERP